MKKKKDKECVAAVVSRCQGWLFGGCPVSRCGRSGDCGGGGEDLQIAAQAQGIRQAFECLGD